MSQLGKPFAGLNFNFNFSLMKLTSGKQVMPPVRVTTLQWIVVKKG